MQIPIDFKLTIMVRVSISSLYDKSTAPIGRSLHHSRIHCVQKKDQNVFVILYKARAIVMKFGV